MREPSRAVKTWLWVVYGMILAMTCIGGITRLTGSGLSMVEWHPLMGALPPLSSEAWHAVFEKYQATPQYQQVNDWMALADFQRIFFWEYLHRLFGRLIGVVVGVPWLVLLATRRLDRPMAVKTFIMLVLGGLQGLLGWYMVSSGLVDVPHVSHLRLAAHLLLAFAVAQYVLWLRLDLDARTDAASPRALRVAAVGVIALVSVQIVYGAFVAGLRAGLLYASWPDMAGRYLPGPFYSRDGLLQSLVFGEHMVHWTHRSLAWLVALACVALGLWAVRIGGPQTKRAGWAVVVLVLVQFGLGVATVMMHVPTAVAVSHQAVALVLLSSLVWLLHRARGAA